MGTKTAPMPRKSGARLTYMRPAAARIWPQARRRTTRSGAVGCHVARASPKATSARRAARTREHRAAARRPGGGAPGRPGRDRVAEGIGRARAEDAAGGHRVGAVAPVLRPRDRLRPLPLEVRPGRAVVERRAAARPSGPRTRSTGTPRSASAASLGIVCTSGRRSCVGPSVSSQPTPCEAELPRKRPSSKKFAWEPAAGRTTGCVPSTSSSLSSSQSARSAPSCWRVADLRGSRRAPRGRPAASKTSWIISQSPSCRLFQSL